MSIPNFQGTSFSLQTTVRGIGFSEAIEKTIAALKTQGFGVLTEIDIKATMKNKLDREERDYVILGACNPQVAHQALSAIPAIGLLLPCNVVVAKNEDKSITIGVIDPVAMFSVVDDPDMAPLAQAVKLMLTDALAQLAEA